MNPSLRLKGSSALGLKVAKNGTTTFFVRVARKLGAENAVLGTTDEITAEQAREKALAAIEASTAECDTGPLFADFGAGVHAPLEAALQAVHKQAVIKVGFVVTNGPDATVSQRT